MLIEQELDDYYRGFNAVHSMCISCVRVWVNSFKQCEGITFGKRKNKEHEREGIGDTSRK